MACAYVSCSPSKIDCIVSMACAAQECVVGAADQAGLWYSGAGRLQQLQDPVQPGHQNFLGGLIRSRVSLKECDYILSFGQDALMKVRMKSARNREFYLFACVASSTQGLSDISDIQNCILMMMMMMISGLFGAWHSTVLIARHSGHAPTTRNFLLFS